MTTPRTDDGSRAAVARPPKRPTPAAALARHVAWLEEALAMARDEETRRQGRLDRAKDKNRDKRTLRLDEVTAEVRELEALVTGIRNLQAKAAGKRRTTTSRATTPGRGAARRKSQAAPSA